MPHPHQQTTTTANNKPKPPHQQPTTPKQNQSKQVESENKLTENDQASPQKTNQSTEREISIPDNHTAISDKPKGKNEISKINHKHTRSKNHKPINKNQQKELNIMYVNANGITGKSESLISAIKEHNTNIVAIVETKLTDRPHNIEGYKWLTKNRQGKKRRMGRPTFLKKNINTK